MRRARFNGFTLIEVLVVIGILGLAAGIGFPAISRAIGGRMFVADATKIDLAVRQARADAIRKSREVRVAPFVPGGGVLAAFGPGPRLAPALHIDQPADLRFFADGSSNGGTLVVTSGPSRFRLVIEPQTGVIRSQWR